MRQLHEVERLGHVAALDWRGLGEAGPLTSTSCTPRPYCAMCVDDVAHVLAHLHERLPSSPLYAVGWSMGGGLLLRHMGEAGEACLLTAAMAVSPAIDLQANYEHMLASPLTQVCQPPRGLLPPPPSPPSVAPPCATTATACASPPSPRLRLVFSALDPPRPSPERASRHSVLPSCHHGVCPVAQCYLPIIMAPLLAYLLHHRAALGTGPDAIGLRDVWHAATTRFGLDGLYARLWGLPGGAAEYHERGSAVHVLNNVRRTALLVHAADDPVCPAHALPVHDIERNPHLLLAVTRHGGHMGYTAGLSPLQHTWTDRVLVHFLRHSLQTAADSRAVAAAARLARWPSSEAQGDRVAHGGREYSQLEVTGAARDKAPSDVAKAMMAVQPVAAAEAIVEGRNAGRCAALHRVVLPSKL